MKAITLNNPFHDFWFNEKSSEIFIVCQRVSAPPNDAYKFSNDYAYNNNLGDTDALFYAYALLYRNYPNTNIHIYYADDFIDKVRDWEKKNILIIGGPNSNNPVCQYFMYEVLIEVYNKLPNEIPRYIFPPKFQKDLKSNENKNYTKEIICKGCVMMADCIRLALCHKSNIDISLIKPEIWDEVIFSEHELGLGNTKDREIRKIGNGKVGISGCVKKDIGLFSTFKNPFDENGNSRIVMIGGIYTFGVLGTCLAMSASSRLSINNYNHLYYQFIDNDSRDFIAYYIVDINKQREVRYSKIENNCIIPFSNKQQNIAINNVFISYRRDNGIYSANKILEILKSKSDEKIFPFIDQIVSNSNFVPGIDYVKEIQNKINQSDIFLPIISPDCFVTGSSSEGGFKAEWLWAVKTGQTIIPVESGASYFEELNKIKTEIVTFFGEETFKALAHLNAVSVNQDNIVDTIVQKLKNHYG